MLRNVEIEKPKGWTGWMDAERLIRLNNRLEEREEAEKMKSYVPRIDPEILEQMRIEAASERPYNRNVIPSK